MLVIGGGVIGLSIAWRARERGMGVTVLERDTLGAGTSRVAAGMLAPVAEAEFGEAARRVLDLGLRSADMWPAFARELGAAAGHDVGLLATGTLLLARNADEARELERQIAFRDSLGLATERLRASQAREREPALAPTVRLRCIRRTTTASTRASCWARCRRLARRRGCSCASTLPSRASRPMRPASASPA